MINMTLDFWANASGAKSIGSCGAQIASWHSIWHMSPQNARYSFFRPSAFDLKCAPWLLTWLMMYSFWPLGRYPYVTRLAGGNLAGQTYEWLGIRHYGNSEALNGSYIYMVTLPAKVTLTITIGDLKRVVVTSAPEGVSSTVCGQSFSWRLVKESQGCV